MRVVTSLLIGLLCASSVVSSGSDPAFAANQTGTSAGTTSGESASVDTSAPRVLRVLRTSSGRGASSEDGLGRDTAIMLNDRQAIVVVPSKLPEKGNRAMVVALHGGMGNAFQAYRNFGLDDAARKYGFVLVYLSGTAAGQFGTTKFMAWNAGGECCGLPAQNKIDDVAYITKAVERLSAVYGIAPGRVYGIGHSNGGMMTQRVMCTTNLYASSISVAGPLMIDAASCPPAKQKRVLDIHGTKDQNVPMDGGRGEKGISGVTFTSEAYTESVYRKSGASFTLLALSGADHKMDNIRSALKSTQKVDLSDVMAKYFGLMPAAATKPAQ